VLRLPDESANLLKTRKNQFQSPVGFELVLEKRLAGRFFP
jgi:hypothetical protein